MSVITAQNLGKIWVKTGADHLHNAEIILRFYCDNAGITPRYLRDATKTRTISALRDTIGKHLCYETNLSLDEIGRLIGRKQFRRPTNDKEK